VEQPTWHLFPPHLQTPVRKLALGQGKYIDTCYLTVGDREIFQRDSLIFCFELLYIVNKPNMIKLLLI